MTSLHLMINEVQYYTCEKKRRHKTTVGVQSRSNWLLSYPFAWCSENNTHTTSRYLYAANEPILYK